MASRPLRIGPSILAADFGHLAEQVAEAETGGADYIHVDVMDGQFVPNISVGLPIVAAVRACTSLPIDVHLMIVEPEKWIEPFARAGADTISIHVEAATHLDGALHAITDAGAEASVALNPSTPLMALEEVLGIVRQVLIMSVNPGYGGQKMIPGAVDKVVRLRAMLDLANPECRVQVDGGINAETIGQVVAAGADSIVAGTAIYSPKHSVEEGIAALRRAAEEAR